MCWRIKKLIITLQLKHLTIKKKYYRHYIQYMRIFVTHRFLRYKNSVVSSSVSHFCLLFPTLQIIIINMHFKHKFILDVYTAWEELNSHFGDIFWSFEIYWPIIFHISKGLKFGNALIFCPHLTERNLQRIM